MKVYVASSWRNLRQPEVVKQLRSQGHEVYDFRHPSPGDDGFNWAEIDPAWEQWTGKQFMAALTSDIAQQGFLSDANALKGADAVVLVMPCGRSSHLELGWAAGAGKPTAILLDGPCEPELMYLLAQFITTDLAKVGRWLNTVLPRQRLGREPRF